MLLRDSGSFYNKITGPSACLINLAPPRQRMFFPMKRGSTPVWHLFGAYNGKDFPFKSKQQHPNDKKSDTMAFFSFFTLS
jgi:hypothetical protein